MIQIRLLTCNELEVHNMLQAHPFDTYNVEHDVSNACICVNKNYV